MLLIPVATSRWWFFILIWLFSLGLGLSRSFLSCSFILFIFYLKKPTYTIQLYFNILQIEWTKKENELKMKSNEVGINSNELKKKRNGKRKISPYQFEDNGGRNVSLSRLWERELFFIQICSFQRKEKNIFSHSCLHQFTCFK